MPAEVWKLMGHTEAEQAHSGKVSKTWHTSITVNILKHKNDVNEYVNYTLIRLLCHNMNIFERVLDQRLRGIVSVTKNQLDYQGLWNSSCHTRGQIANQSSILRLRESL